LTLGDHTEYLPATGVNETQENTLVLSDSEQEICYVKTQISKHYRPRIFYWHVLFAKQLYNQA
jgi:phage-related protein